VYFFISLVPTYQKGMLDVAQTFSFYRCLHINFELHVKPNSLARIHEMFLVYLDCFNYTQSKLPTGRTDCIKV